MLNEPGRKPVIHTKKHVARQERERRQIRLILFAFIGILLTVLLLVGYGYMDINYFQLKKPVAKVGNVEIKVEEFEARVRLQRQQLLVSYNQNVQYSQIFGIDTSQQIQQIEYYLNTPAVLGQSVLDQMINEELIRQEAEKRGIAVGADELDQFIRSEFRYFPDGTYTPTVTPTEAVMPDAPAAAFNIVTRTPTASATSALATSALAAALTSDLTVTGAPSQTPTATLLPTATATTGPTSTAVPTATPYTLEGFQSEYDSTLADFRKFGLDEAGYRKLMDIQILQTKLKDAIAADVTNSEEQIWARHILVSDPAVAVTVIERLKAGEDFSTLATELSEDTGSAVQGGDLGWFGKNAMVAEFETAAFALKNPGDFTLEPVQSQFGYHIIQLIARQVRPLTASQFEQARTKVFEDWLTAARETYAVETYDLWTERVPTDPNLSTIATDAVETAKAQPTATP